MNVSSLNSYETSGSLQQQSYDDRGNIVVTDVHANVVESDKVKLAARMYQPNTRHFGDYLDYVVAKDPAKSPLAGATVTYLGNDGRPYVARTGADAGLQKVISTNLWQVKLANH